MSIDSIDKASCDEVRDWIQSISENGEYLKERDNTTSLPGIVQEIVDLHENKRGGG